MEETGEQEELPHGEQRRCGRQTALYRFVGVEVELLYRARGIRAALREMRGIGSAESDGAISWR